MWMIWEGKAVSHTSQRKRNIEIVISRGFGLFRAQNHNWSPWGHYWSLRWCLYSSCHCSWMTGKKRSDYIQRGLSRSCEICSLDDVVLIGLFFVRVVGTTVSPRWKLSDQISALKLLLPVENNRLMFQWMWFYKCASMPLKRLKKAIRVKFVHSLISIPKFEKMFCFKSFLQGHYCQGCDGAIWIQLNK